MGTQKPSFHLRSCPSCPCALVIETHKLGRNPAKAEGHKIWSVKGQEDERVQGQKGRRVGECKYRNA